MILRSLGLGAIAICSGCASITTGQDQVVAVETPNCPAVACELENKEGKYYVSRTPGSVTVNRKCSEMTVRCGMEGEPAFVMSVGASVKAMTFGNILFGGIIGVGVDTATGAACKYPSIIPVPMNCQGEVAFPEFEPVGDLPESVSKAMDRLECVDIARVGEVGEETTVYAAKCEGDDALLTCDLNKCEMSKYQTGSDEPV